MAAPATGVATCHAEGRDEEQVFYDGENSAAEGGAGAVGVGGQAGGDGVVEERLKEEQARVAVQPPFAQRLLERRQPRGLGRGGGECCSRNRRWLCLCV